MKYACGYNPNFLDSKLKIPDHINLIEMGIAAYDAVSSPSNKYSSFENYSGSISLHISRSPITECIEFQQSYIDNVLPDALIADNTISIGLHICGERHLNIGKYGFGSHYEPSEVYESRAATFVDLLQCKYNVPVWIENANFYSSSAREVSDTIASVNSICTDAECFQIVDLAHLAIDSRNAGISPHTLISAIDWTQVIEIHLSGIVEGKDGTLHDGHSLPVANDCWDMLKDLIALGRISPECYVNIEHSDTVWVDNLDEYQNDFKRLFELESSPPIECDLVNRRESYAKSYLVKSLKRSVDNLDTIGSSLNISEAELIGGWINSVDNSASTLSLTENEANDPLRKDNTQHYLKSFVNYVDELQDVRG